MRIGVVGGSRSEEGRYAAGAFPQVSHGKYWTLDSLLESLYHAVTAVADQCRNAKTDRMFRRYFGKFGTESPSRHGCPGLDARRIDPADRHRVILPLSAFLRSQPSSACLDCGRCPCYFYIQCMENRERLVELTGFPNGNIHSNSNTSRMKCSRSG